MQDNQNISFYAQIVVQKIKAEGERTKILKETLTHCWWACKMVQLLWKSLAISYKT